MPLYEYECDRGHRFERIVKFSDPPIDACPECGAPVHKLMSSPAFQFKGTGWYVTDYARKGETKDKDAKETKPAGESKKDSTETKETKTEKPATETATSSKSETTSTPSTKSD
jgi:putative FmdB family regulatory protein